MAVYPADAANLPAVIYIHGFGGNRESGLEMGYRLANAGIFFLSFDCWHHGERTHDNERNLLFPDVYPPETGMDTYFKMHEIIRQTEEDLNFLAGHLRRDPRVDSERLGVAGFSMGGFATFLAAARCPWLQVAAAIGGKPAFQRAWDDLIMACETYPQWREAMVSLQKASEERSSYLASFDPFEELVGFANKPLMIINGDQDTDQLYLYSLELYRKLRPFYANDPEKLWLHMPPIGHCVTPEVMHEVTRWFKRHL